MLMNEELNRQIEKEIREEVLGRMREAGTFLLNKEPERVSPERLSHLGVNPDEVAREYSIDEIDEPDIMEEIGRLMRSRAIRKIVINGCADAEVIVSYVKRAKEEGIDCLVSGNPNYIGEKGIVLLN
jgi:metal-dependent hydrolase (beta-lactamase superfamily II)